MPKLNLSSKQYMELIEAQRNLYYTDKRNQRVEAILLKAQAKNLKQIGKELNRSPQTIANWLKKYQKGGIEALLSDKNNGRPSQLTKKQLDQLKEKITAGDFKKALDAKIFIKEEYGLDFHLHYVQSLIKRSFKVHPSKLKIS